jgi:hypothetical protein
LTQFHGHCILKNSPAFYNISDVNQVQLL